MQDKKESKKKVTIEITLGFPESQRKYVEWIANVKFLVLAAPLN